MSSKSKSTTGSLIYKFLKSGTDTSVPVDVNNIARWNIETDEIVGKRVFKSGTSLERFYNLL